MEFWKKSVWEVPKVRQLEKGRSKFISKDPHCTHCTPWPDPDYIKRVLCTHHQCSQVVHLHLRWWEGEEANSSAQKIVPRSLRSLKMYQTTLNSDILGLSDTICVWAHSNMGTRYVCELEGNVALNSCVVRCSEHFEEKDNLQV